MKSRGCGVVRTGRADDIKPLEPILGFKRTQGIGLTGDADKGQARDPARLCEF